MYFLHKINVSLSTLLYPVHSHWSVLLYALHVDKQAYLICLLSEILQYQKPKGITEREGDVSKILKIIIEKVKSFID